jgi:RNA polymerase sigma-70 factor (ECF subfamily)
MARSQPLAAWPVTDRQSGAPTLEALFRRYHRQVYAAAYRVSGDAMDAEDALQTVFTNVARSGTGALPRDGGGVEGYLRRAGANAALDIMRRRARRPATSLEHAAAVAAPEGGHSASAAEQELVRAAIAALPTRGGEMFVLRYLEGYSNREIGALLGTSESVVGVTLHRARGQVIEWLARHRAAGPPDGAKE